MKRRRVDDRTAVPLSLVAGIVAAASGASPTGTTWSDWIVIVASVGLVTWAGASTPWWAAAAVAGLAAAVAVDLTLTVIGLVAFAVGLWIGLQGRDVPLVRAAVVGVAMNVLIRSQLEGFLGLSTIIGVTAGAAIVMIGLARRRTRIRRRVWWGLALTAALGVLAVAGSAAAALSSRDDLTSGNRQARAALELVNDGDYAAAAAGFDEAAASFAGADDALTAPWALPARLVPGVAQNLTAAQGLASAAAEASIDLSAALGVVDPEQLRVVDGRLDIDAVRLIQEPFHDVQDSIGSLESAIDDAESPWLISPLATRLADLDEELTDNGDRLDNAVLAVDLAPQLLGADEPRRYFVAFTTPAEVRGHGGFMGNWVEMTADGGRLTVSASGRTSDLNDATTDRALDHRPRRLVGPVGRLRIHERPRWNHGRRAVVEHHDLAAVPVDRAGDRRAVSAERRRRTRRRVRHGPLRVGGAVGPDRPGVGRQRGHPARSAQRAAVPARRPVRDRRLADPRRPARRGVDGPRSIGCSAVRSRTPPWSPASWARSPPRGA